MVAAAQKLCAEAQGGELLLLVRPPAFLCCSLASFPPLEAGSSSVARYVMVYAAGTSQLLTAGLALVRGALEAKTRGWTLDAEALTPVSLAGALIMPLEAGTLAAELLRPSARHALMLRLSTGHLAYASARGEELLAMAADKQLGLSSAPVTPAIKAIQSAACGVLCKLEGLARGPGRTRHKGKVSSRRKGGAAPSATASKLLAALPAEDARAHVEMLSVWCQELLDMVGTSVVGAGLRAYDLQAIRTDFATAMDSALSGVEPGAGAGAAILEAQLDGLFIRWRELIQTAAEAAAACSPSGSRYYSIIGAHFLAQLARSPAVGCRV